ncbi:iron-sulfur cluster biosynthesis family protein [Lagierella sp.]|uniref:iron-sulfur cluster biosynthesis family protein n=1 Tax=Lagierella sp. TaxID=2849657 RepID=UPI00260620BC|nr:iron-sulfur cluster biosynthesis family protein [Lagierella sp.]
MKVTVKDAAVNELKRLLESTGKEYLRFEIGAKTCCDYIFTLIPSEKTDRDAEMEDSGIKFLIYEDIKDTYEEAIVDYVAEGFARGLKIELK